MAGPSFTMTTFTPYLNSAMAEIELWWGRITTHSDIMTKLTSALVILVITLFISGWLSDGVKKLARRMIHSDADRTFPEFLSQVMRWIILTLGFVAIMNRLGIETTSFITVLGAASLSIGLALQGTLGNVAAGLMILFTKPYRIGDSVSSGETRGRIHRLGLFNTEIDDVDNVRVYVPNSKIFTNEIKNTSTNGAIKLELKLDVDYSADLLKVQKLLHDVAAAQPDHLTSHDPWVGFQDFSDKGITVRVWIWVLPAHGVRARSALIVAVKAALDAAGIDVPYPHQVSIAKPQA